MMEAPTTIEWEMVGNATWRSHQLRSAVAIIKEILAAFALLLKTALTRAKVGVMEIVNGSPMNVSQ
jgi:hypothetical protein